MPTSTPDDFDPVEATVAETHDAMSEGHLTAAGLVDAYRARIDAYDDDLNAILCHNEAARDRAERLDERFEREGFVGPLHGIPVVVKDNQNTGDMPTTAGSVALADSQPDRDAFVVARLREAGAVVLAKTNLQEFSFGVDTVSSLGGETRNAYDLGRRPSGSSGGTAAAVAASLAVLGTGSDTCSSVRSPPAFNDLVGVRPTMGLVSRTGIIPLSSTQDTAGPITRTVADAARMLDVLVGYDPEDPITGRGVPHVPEDGYVSHVDQDGLEGARIGVVRQLFGIQQEGSAEPADAQAVTEVIDDAIGAFETAGATIVDPFDVGDLGRIRSARMVEYEFARDFNAYLDDLGEAAPYGSLAEVVATGEVHPSIEARIEATGVLDVDTDTVNDDPNYLRRLRRRRKLRTETEARMVDANLDAVLYPPSTVPPVEIPKNQPFKELNCELSAHTGLPSIVVPAGFTDDGLPVGVELLGHAFAEPRLFELASAFERATDNRRPPEGFGPVA